MNGSLSESTRTYVSLALFMHLFCVAAVLSGNFFPSSLQTKLAKTVGIYTQTLHLDPGWVPFELTDGESGPEGYYRWQIVETSDTGSNKVLREFPGSEQPLRGGFQRLRHEAFARLAASYSSEGVDDEVCATMARALAQHHFKSNGQSQSTDNGRQANTRLLIRCVGSDFAEESVDDENEAFAAVYEADAWLSNGKVNVLKRMEARRTAPPVSEANVSQ